jgi:hypothetical protein
MLSDAHHPIARRNAWVVRCDARLQRGREPTHVTSCRPSPPPAKVDTQSRRNTVLSLLSLVGAGTQRGAEVLADTTASPTEFYMDWSYVEVRLEGRVRPPGGFPDFGFWGFEQGEDSQPADDVCIAKQGMTCCLTYTLSRSQTAEGHPEVYLQERGPRRRPCGYRSHRPIWAVLSHVRA